MPANKGKGKKAKKGSSGNNSSKKSKKKEATKSRERKEIDDVGQSPHVEEGNHKIADSEKALSKKDRRKLKKEKKKKEKQRTQSAGSPDESNETPNITAEQSNSNSEISSPSDKDKTNQDLVNDHNLSSADEKSNNSDQPGQQGSSGDKNGAKRENSGAGEKSNNIKSKKTNSSSSSRRPSLADFLYKLKETLKSVSDNNISSVLREVHKSKFTSLNEQEVEQCLIWIIESANDLAKSEYAKGLYVCAILGHVAITTSPDKCFQLPTHKATAQACDALLRCLVISSRKKLFISRECNILLEAIAPVLVKNSSSPGWLTFAANFVPLFGLKYILEINNASPQYKKETYMELCQLLLSHDIVNIRNAPKEDKPHYNQFLKQILKLAPDEGSLFKVFAIKEIRRFFYSQHDQDKFCTEFYKDNVQTTTGADIGEKLQQLTNLPKNLRFQLSGVLYSYLLEFIKSIEMPTDKDVENFMEIQLSLKLSDGQIHNILILLSTSETVRYQELFLKLLDDERFMGQWQNVRRTAKVEICFTWIKTRACANKMKEIKVEKVYQAAGEITSCTLVTNNKNFKEYLLRNVRGWLSENVPPEVIFQELKDLDQFRQFDVRESCIHLITDVLHNKLHIVNDKSLLSQFSHSR